MTPAEEYLFKAAELHARAEDEKDETAKTEFRLLADFYLRLADHWTRNSAVNRTAAGGSAPDHR